MAELLAQLGMAGPALLVTLSAAVFAIILNGIEATGEYRESVKVQDLIARIKFFGGLLAASVALGVGIVVVTGSPSMWWLGPVAVTAVGVILAVVARKIHSRDISNVADPDLAAIVSDYSELQANLKELNDKLAGYQAVNASLTTRLEALTTSAANTAPATSGGVGG